MDDPDNPGANLSYQGLYERTPPESQTLAPDFLIISPSKTGSTWLSANLQHHPDIFVPSIKEVNYFSYFHRCLSLDWYLSVFRPGMNRVKGEASPCYAALPQYAIREIHALFPNTKLIYLMRDPVERAWSHAKHNCKYREANFRDFELEINDVPDVMWRENFTHPWPSSHGDYLGHLRRWAAVFPRQQLFVGFFEQIVADPHSLLRDIFGFLGVDREIDWTGFPVEDKVMEGSRKKLPSALRVSLRGLLAPRTRQLTEYLQATFRLTYPPEWSDVDTSDSMAHTAVSSVPLVCTCDDDFLASLLERNPPVQLTTVEMGFLGFNLLWYQGRLFALAQRLGPVDARAIIDGDFQRYAARAEALTAPTLVELKALVQDVVAQPPPDTGSRWPRVLRSLRSMFRQLWRLPSSTPNSFRRL